MYPAVCLKNEHPSILHELLFAGGQKVVIVNDLQATHAELLGGYSWRLQNDTGGEGRQASDPPCLLAQYLVQSEQAYNIGQPDVALVQNPEVHVSQ